MIVRLPLDRIKKGNGNAAPTRHSGSHRTRIFRVSSHQWLFRHVQQRIALYGRDEFCEPLVPRVLSLRGHDAAGRVRRDFECHYRRARLSCSEVCQINGTGRDEWLGRVGASGDGKLMERSPGDSMFSFQREENHFYPRGTSVSRKSTMYRRHLNRAASIPSLLLPRTTRMSERWLVKLIRVKWSLNGTRIDCQTVDRAFAAQWNDIDDVL